MIEISPLQKSRYAYKPKLPQSIEIGSGDLHVIERNTHDLTDSHNEIKAQFPHSYSNTPVVFDRDATAKNSKPIATEQIRKIGIILSGGQAPGGHNVIAGIFDALKTANPASQLYGFKGGPSGIINDDVMEITPQIMDKYRNTGGFDIIGSGRTKLETEDQFKKSLETCNKHGIDAVVIIGGDDSNTNAAILAEWFKANKSPVTVVGCPKTIDGDLKNMDIETSFGFDTATKTYSELIGNIAKDANSAKKYWHFIKLMGRSASHIALECALQTKPNICIISEEVRSKNLSLDDIVKQIADVIMQRATQDMNFGVALIPEGLIEFIPEMGQLISELNDILANDAKYFSSLKTREDQLEWVNHEMSDKASHVFASLPRGIKIQLLDDRDPHGNVQVSRIDTEKLLIELVSEYLERMKLTGKFEGNFSPLAHFFGYEGRCAFPSNFDCDYCYSLGYSAFLLVSSGLTGYISSVRNLHKPASDWIAGGAPLTSMMNMEKRYGEMKPVIKKALVELDGASFKYFSDNRDEWARKTAYRFPGAIQYFGPPDVCDEPTITLKMERQS